MADSFPAMLYENNNLSEMEIEYLKDFRNNTCYLIDSREWPANWFRGDRLNLAYINAELARRIKQS